jgi:hypothetical protein
MQKLSITKDMSPTEIKLAVIKVVSGLDFHEIKMVMEVLEWTWQINKHTPTQEELFDSATERGVETVMRCIKSGHRSKISSGGFTADAEMFPDGDIGLSVWFEVTECGNYL